MNRENFTDRTRRIIADRAGHRCSFPTCHRLTVGPGFGNMETSGSGVAAHIFSASKNGPRGQGGLSPEELRQPENGIWLCAEHAKYVDNNRGEGFPPEWLLSYKALHEARAALESQGMYSPIGWIHQIKVKQSPIFIDNTIVRFTKLNLILGSNESGKTALIEWLVNAFKLGSRASRWNKTTNKQQIEVEIEMLNPQLRKITHKFGLNTETYNIDGQDVAWNPIDLRIIKVGLFDFNRTDDKSELSRILSLPEFAIETLADDINSFDFAKIRNVHFDEYENDSYSLVCDVDGTVPGLTLDQLSHRDAETVIIEFATAAARVSGIYAPTMLILDGSIYNIFDGFFDFYSHHFLDPTNQFQTVLVIPIIGFDLSPLRWLGWEVIRTVGSIPNISISQEFRQT